MRPGRMMGGRCYWAHVMHRLSELQRRGGVVHPLVEDNAWQRRLDDELEQQPASSIKSNATGGALRRATTATSDDSDDDNSKSKRRRLIQPLKIRALDCCNCA